MDLGHYRLLSQNHSVSLINLRSLSKLNVQYLFIIPAHIPFVGVIERWELLQAQNFNELDMKDLEQWQKLNSDLCDVTSWLGRVLPELERLQRIAPSTSIRGIEANIWKLKVSTRMMLQFKHIPAFSFIPRIKATLSSLPSLQEMQKTFNGFKCLMISINLSSRHFQHGDGAEVRELQDALSSANHSWTQACSGLESWETTLHSGLMQCQVGMRNTSLLPPLKSQ